MRRTGGTSRDARAAVQADPLAAPGNVGQGAGGFGTGAPAAGTANDTDFEVVDIEAGPTRAPSSKADAGAESKKGGGLFGRGGGGGGAAGATPGLAERERALNAKERELAPKQEAIDKQLGVVNGVPLRVNNWPPCYPVLHHDVACDASCRSASATSSACAPPAPRPPAQLPRL